MSRSRVKFLILLLGLVTWGTVIGFSVKHVVEARDLAHDSVKPLIPEVIKHIDDDPAPPMPDYPAEALVTELESQWEESARVPSYSKTTLADPRKVDVVAPGPIKPPLN